MAAALLCFCYAASPASASESLCDPAYQDCRTTLINDIRNETVGIDVAFWFMEDSRYSTEIINRWKAGVPVRVIMDQRALPSQGGTHPDEVAILQSIVSAGIPVRQRWLSVSGILHWKAMIFAGQNVVEFDGANYSPWAFIYVTPYSNYEWESVYFTDDPSLVNSFKTWFDNFWIDYSFYADYANITNPPVRNYPIYPKDPALNFPQEESYYSRIAKRYTAETQKIDVIMFRITDERHTDQMIAAMQRGLPVRIIGDTDEYRLPSRQWVSYNLDKLYAAGIPLRVRGAQGLNHQKLVILYGQQMAVFGSSNWTTPSDQSQQEHNYFTTKPWMFQWFVDQFERKWNNTNPAGVTETQPFVPLPPDKPVSLSPASGAVGTSISMALKWDGGYYGQFYDIYFGTDPNPPLFAGNLQLGPTDYANPSQTQKLVLPLLQHGTTYYWRIVSRTMAGLTAKGPTQSFTTYGAPPPPVTPPTGASTIVMWTATDVAAGDIFGNWQYTTDATAAGGKALRNPDKATAKISPPLAAPTTYFEIPFSAMSGTAYHLWLRLRAQANTTLNNSVSVQFDDAIDQYGSPLYRIGSAQGAEVILQDPSGTLNGWGWADNSFGGALTPIYVSSTGPHRLRVQQRSDGAIVDQIILSPDAFAASSPGGTSSDTHIYGSTLDGSPPPTPSSPPPPTYPPVPLPWQQADIGTVGMPGYGEFDNNSAVFSVAGAGADVWGTADALHYVYQPLSGDGTIVAQVTSVQNTNAWVKAGVMIRESLAANARQGFMLLSYSKGTAFQRRTSTAGASVSTTGSSVVAPYWVRIDRSGNTFTAYQSPDGSTWTLVGTDTIAMAGSALIGLAVSSHTTDAAALVTFAQVAVNGVSVTPPPPPPPPQCSYSISPANASVPSTGGTGTIALTASDPSCMWTATPSAPWISISSASSGVGSGAAGFTVAANTGDVRNGSVAIANQTFAIAQAAAPPPPPGLPSGWSHQDVGAVGMAGDTRYDPGTGTFTVIGAGADVWGSADALHYACTPLTGDGSVVARVVTVQNTNAWTKAGAMIRETLDPASAQGFMLVSFGKGTAFQRRRVAAGTSVSTTGLSTAVAPYWVRVDRIGNTVNAYQSVDGNAWALVDTDTIAMAATVMVGLGVSSHSTTATASATFDHVVVTSGTPTAPLTLPSPWLHQDIGAVGAAGAASFNPQTNVFAVKGAGADIWGTADAFHFAYKPLAGDGVIVARVATVQNVASWTKGGVMIRETLDPGSAQALMLVSASKGLAFQRRPIAGGTSVSTAGGLVAAPQWLKLERIGNTFNAYSSADGTTWTLVGTDTIPMAATVNVGFAVGSHTTTAAAQVTFDNVSVP
jgi:regulation of enolase protein 1 (concanavalin A-like superfamily)/phosphatidylserine/phosphatidylglycerophosphate/cardiolipin synthase-like enzyme